MEAVPTARIRWRYRLTLNALAVVVPASTAGRLESLPGVREVYRTSLYRPTLDRSPATIRAPVLWGPALGTAGQGIKIAIVDDGIEQRHPFFDPTGYVMPPGFPKGNAAYTTAKVVVARSFPPPSPRVRNAALPFDPEESEHGTHVAGIAAGNNGTRAPAGQLSGVAPRAYLGNYRVLTIPTASNVGLDGNSPEIAAGIEAAVADGMDVINLSIGEPEIPPARDLVVRALEGAARAGVVPVVSAGNDFGAFGDGSVSSPGSAPSAITVGATSLARRVAPFSSAGPTPFSLRLKPELSAPGLEIVSSVPAREGTWEAFSGTSMAAPHIAGGAALLQQRHPAWTPAQVKSALVTTAVAASDNGGEARPTRAGAGFVDLARADNPLLFASPTAFSFGLVRRGRIAARRIALTDAGTGAGQWTVSGSRRLSFPGRVTVPGTLVVRLRASRRLGDAAGVIVLRRGAETRRIPYWGRVTAPQLVRHKTRPLTRTGTYRGNTRGRRALVSVYRYPEDPTGSGIPRTLGGPEQVFRIRLRRPAGNFGVAILDRSRARGVQPRIVVGRDENRVAGPTALPLNTNPYLPTFLQPTPVAGVIRPAAGVYEVVFDSTSAVGAGPFSFRFWVGDETRPSVRLVTRAVRAGSPLVLSASDRGSGVDRRSIFATVDGRSRQAAYSRGRGRITIPVGRLAAGRHRLVVQVSDHQEAKNMENALRILPNTTRLELQFSVR